MKKPKELLHTVLDAPVTGFAPWILLAVVNGPGRVVLAAGLACATGALLCAAGALTGKRPKLLDLTAIIFFGGLAIVAALASTGTRHWLGVWSSELSTIAIALVALVSLAIRRPFTLQYARETTDRAFWKTPLFLRINNIITTVWAAVLAVMAIVGYVGAGPLHQPNDIWTGWIIPVGLVVLAAKFTGWYPDHATATAAHSADAARPTPARLASELARPLTAYLVPVGILVVIIGGARWWVGAGLIVIGIAFARLLRKTPVPATAPVVRDDRQPS
jgi:hypothetical protein